MYKYVEKAEGYLVARVGEAFPVSRGDSLLRHVTHGFLTGVARGLPHLAIVASARLVGGKRLAQVVHVGLTAAFVHRALTKVAQ